MDKILELAQQHGGWAVLGAALLYIFVKIAPEAFKYFKKKKEKEDEAELEEKKFDSVHVVFGVDDNKDVWMYSVFKTQQEANEYINSIKPVIEEGIVLLTNECQFNKPIKGFEAYNPYSQKYFGTERCSVSESKILPEKTSQNNYSIYNASANSYIRIREWMENKND